MIKKFPLSEKFKKNFWRKIEGTGDIPSRYNASAIIYNQELYIFGGWHPEFKPTNDLFKFSFKTLNWEKIETTGTPPSPRLGQESIVYNKQMIVCFGSNDSVLFSDTFAYDFENKNWSTLHTKGQKPRARLDPIIALWDHKMFIFGGESENSEKLNDVFYLDFNDDLKWIPVLNRKNAPPPMSDMAGAQVNHLLFIHGGMGSHISSDIYCFDMEKLKWKKKIKQKTLHLNDDHKMIYFNNSLFVYGGSQGRSNRYLKRFVVFDLESKEWNEIEYQKNDEKTKDEKIGGNYNFNEIEEYEEDSEFPILFEDSRITLPDSQSKPAIPGGKIGPCFVLYNYTLVLFSGSYGHQFNRRKMENEMYIYPLQIPRFCQEMLDVLRGCVVADFNIVSADNVVFQVHKSIILTRIRRYGTISKMNLMSNISNEVILQGNTQENSQNNNLYFDNEDQQLNSFCNLMRRYRYSTVYSLLQYFYSGLMIGIDGAVAHEFEEIATLLKFDRLLKSVQSQSFGEIHLEELVEDLRFMLENERFTDFTVMLHNENSNQKIPIKTHKVILAARSELYRGMLTSVVDQSNSAPDLSGRQLGALLTLFLYLYTDKLNINSIEDALQLFGAYSYYGLSDSLFDRKICAYLYHNLNIDNAIQICEGLLPHWNLIPAVREFGNTILRFIHENPVLIPSWKLLVQKYSFLSQEAFDLSQEVFPESIDYYNKVNLNKDENKMLQNHDNSDDSSNDSDDDVGGGDW